MAELFEGKAAARRGTEADVEHDDHQALRRRTGGVSGTADESTTGTGKNETFVGRVAGEDPADQETGAERRARLRDHTKDEDR
ncbi:MAG: hypothetical protein GEV10_10075 [Streptosporangiales bacterium]|nr:hypothetical protein [Streptosporangiales bacterium]